jgi:CrcB protein
VRSALTIGFVGGLTTYSSFNYDTMRLFDEGAAVTAVANVALPPAGGLIAGWFGTVVAREILGQ